MLDYDELLEYCDDDKIAIDIINHLKMKRRFILYVMLIIMLYPLFLISDKIKDLNAILIISILLYAVVYVISLWNMILVFIKFNYEEECYINCVLSHKATVIKKFDFVRKESCSFAFVKDEKNNLIRIDISKLKLLPNTKYIQCKEIVKINDSKIIKKYVPIDAIQDGEGGTYSNKSKEKLLSDINALEIQLEHFNSNYQRKRGI